MRHQLTPLAFRVLVTTKKAAHKTRMGTKKEATVTRTE